MDLVTQVQHPDGGWVDNEDTIWCTALLTMGQGHEQRLRLALDWLAQQRSEGGGWGRNPREPARIPFTAIALRFLGPRIETEADRACLETMWASDLVADLKLSYKGGFFLLAQAPDCHSDLAIRTIEYLTLEANDDGGFGPWRGHPIGSDPWSTGICLAGLCRCPDLAPRSVIERAVEWLLRTQLPSGYWPYHFIDEGTAYAYWGLSEAAKLLHGD
jgi:prenyltransferase beta subunit